MNEATRVCPACPPPTMEDWKTRITQIRPVEKQASDPEQACLVLIYPAGAELGKRYELAGAKEITIGRGADCDIQVDRDSVSRRHAKVTRAGTGWTVADLGSTNGSYVNDAQITQYSLRDGDLLKIGNAIFKFLVGGNIETAYHEEIYRMTIIDGLTQAFNKRYFIENLEKEIPRCTRHQRPLSLVMFDIDHFKKINDEHGHLTGDYVLKELARRVRTRVRKEEVFARYGGEEFALTLPETSRDQSMKVAEDLRRLVSAEPFDFEGDHIAVIDLARRRHDGERGRRRRVHQDGRRQSLQGQARRPQQGHRLGLRPPALESPGRAERSAGGRRDYIDVQMVAQVICEVVAAGGGVGVPVAPVPRSMEMVSSSQVVALAGEPLDAQLGVSVRCAGCTTGWQLGGSLHVAGVGDTKQLPLL